MVGNYLSYDPYGIMYRKNDGDFAVVVVSRVCPKLMSSGGNRQDLRQIGSAKTAFGRNHRHADEPAAQSCI